MTNTTSPFLTWQFYAALLLATFGARVSHYMGTTVWSGLVGGLLIGIACAWCHAQGIRQGQRMKLHEVLASGRSGKLLEAFEKEVLGG